MGFYLVEIFYGFGKKYGYINGSGEIQRKKKKRRSRKCFFRFLFGHQKGTGVWGKAPLLPLKMNEQPI